MSQKSDLHAYGFAFETIDVILQHCGNALVMMSEAYHGYVEGAAQMNHEFARFLRDRLDKNRDFGHALSAVERLEEATSLHHDWLRVAADDWLAQTTRVFEIFTTAAANGRANGHGLPVKVEDGAPAKKTAAKPANGD